MNKRSALTLSAPQGLAQAIKKKQQRNNLEILEITTLLVLFRFPSYALPTKTTEVMVMPEQSTKMHVDAVLKTHERVVQVKPRKRPHFRHSLSRVIFICVALSSEEKLFR